VKPVHRPLLFTMQMRPITRKRNEIAQLF
jgi:hypothetical protein